MDDLRDALDEADSRLDVCEAEADLLAANFDSALASFTAMLAASDSRDDAAFAESYANLAVSRDSRDSYIGC
ncbi:hypothetical protein C5C44_11985 [Rathayibacter sp. AY1F6]|nr:hypothetical protein C5C30_13445 [Rathayibacter sp. AY2B5]PPH02822.1 hypothetical protein C5C44_11985 [Rathayibacter sp. AY1F6]PPH51694.1 hypothetical protein C5C49_11485 [Rathayibacter sp. AY1E2]PPH78896.1 hypothetical protein C5C50_13730 [Rathayibacter sp. AY1D9]